MQKVKLSGGTGAMTDYETSSPAPWYISYGTSITTVVIAKGVTSIGKMAFSGCTGLTSITICNPNCVIDDSQDTIDSRATIYGYANSTA